LKNYPPKRQLRAAQSLLLLTVLSQSLVTSTCYGAKASTDSFFALIAAEPAETSMVLKGIYDPDKGTTSSAADASPVTAGESEETPIVDSDQTTKVEAAPDKAKEEPKTEKKVESQATTSEDNLKTGITVNKIISPNDAIKLGGQSIGSATLKCVEFAPATDPFEEAINSAAIVAMERDSELVEADNKLYTMQGKSQSAKEISRNFLHYLLNYRGVGPSSASANALMERTINTSSVLAAELKWEKSVDEKYVATVNAASELAEAMDLPEGSEMDSAVNDAKANLAELVGPDEANNLVAKFKALKKVLPKSTPQLKNATVAKERASVRALEESIIKQDPILSEVAEKLNKYAVKKRTEVLTGAVQSALGVAGLAPSILGPCAQLAKTAFILSTGGSEENKLYKEVFLFKRIEVRTRTISQLSSTAVRSYNFACLTNRPFLAAYAQSLMNKMADKETVDKIVAGDIDTRMTAEIAAQPETKGTTLESAVNSVNTGSPVTQPEKKEVEAEAVSGKTAPGKDSTNNQLD